MASTAAVRKQKVKRVVKSVPARLFRLLLLCGIAFVILQPFLIRILSSFMSVEDVYDSLVKYVPRAFSFKNYSLVVTGTGYWKALFNTAMVSLLCAFLQVMVCAFVGYGLARYKFRGRSIVFAVVIFSMILPPQTTFISLYLNMRFFDPFMIPSVLGLTPLRLVDSPMPLFLMSATGLAFKNGLYILLMRQLFRGLPDEIKEAAEVDGAGQMRIYFQIMLPMASSMAVTIFMLAFSWQWTDTFYSSLFFVSNFTVLTGTLDRLQNIRIEGLTAFGNFNQVLINTASILVVLPLVILFIFAQKRLIQGVERSGIVG